MSAAARCPHCSKTVATPPEWDGSMFACPSCGGKVGLLDSVGSSDFAAASSPPLPSDERQRAALAETERTGGRRDLRVGLAFFGGGLAATILTRILAEAAGLGFYVVFWGAVLFGFLLAVRGASRLLRHRPRKLVEADAVVLKPLLGLVLIFCLIMGAAAVLPFAEPRGKTLFDWLLLAGLNLIPVAWAGLVIWRTRRQETWMSTSREAWLIGMGLAYAVGIAGGIYVFVFN